jgi:hypothetical protein
LPGGRTLWSVYARLPASFLFGRAVRRETMDIFYIIVALLFFAGCALYVRGCEKL